MQRIFSDVQLQDGRPRDGLPEPCAQKSAGNSRHTVVANVQMLEKLHGVKSAVFDTKNNNGLREYIRNIDIVYNTIFCVSYSIVCL